MVFFGIYVRLVLKFKWLKLSSVKEAIQPGWAWLALAVGCKPLFGHLVIGHVWDVPRHGYNLTYRRVWGFVLLWIAASHGHALDTARAIILSGLTTAGTGRHRVLPLIRGPDDGPETLDLQAYPICATFDPKNGGEAMSKTAMVRARVEPDLKDHVESIFRRLGLNATQAITMFYRQVELRDGLPFDVVVPTEMTKRTFEASEAGRELVVCEDSDDMFRKLGI